MERRPAKVVRSERFATRRREVRRSHARRRRRITFTVVILIALGSGGLVLARSSLFALEGIEVRGTRLLTQAEVLQASGLRAGQSMLSLHADRVRGRIENLPLVREVTVERVPTSRILITVFERAPSFILETVESRWYLDEQATLLGEVGETVPALPTIRLAAPLTADTGDRARTPDLVDALRLWAALPDSLKAGRPTIAATDADGLILLRGELDIRFGTLDRLEEKLRAVQLVQERVRLSHDRLASLDVRSPTRPAAKLA